MTGNPYTPVWASGWSNGGKTLARGPLFDDDAEVVELLDGGFEVAANLGAVLAAGQGRLGDGDDAAIAPCAGRQGDQGLGEVGGAQLHLLAAGGLGAEHGSLAHGAGVGVGEGDAQVEGAGIDREEGIGPRARLMHIHIHALGGQRDQEAVPLIYQVIYSTTLSNPYLIAS